MKTKTSLLLLSLILILAACQAQAESTPAAPVSPLSATLSEVTGKVDVKQARQENFSAASAGSVIEIGGQIQTGDDGRGRLDLTSGTIIRIAPSSLFTFTSNKEVEGSFATSIKIEFGKIFIILNGGTADVDTPSGVASVRGSYMKVEVDTATLDVYVTCLEGNCSVKNPAGSVNFGQGEKTTLFQKDPSTGNWKTPNVEPMSPEDFQEWLDENTETSELFNQAMATMTALSKPTATAVATAVIETAVPAPASAAGTVKACLGAVQPVAGANLPFQGKVKFEWEPQPGAQKYVITFNNSDKSVARFETTETNIEKFVEGFIPSSGEFSWSISAYAEDGNMICTTEKITFSKPESYPQQPTPIPEIEESPKGESTVVPTPEEPPTPEESPIPQYQ